MNLLGNIANYIVTHPWAFWLFYVFNTLFILNALTPGSNEIHYTKAQMEIAKRKMKEICDKEKGKDHPLL